MSDYNFHFTVTDITLGQAENILSDIIRSVESATVLVGKTPTIAGGFVDAQQEEKQEVGRGQTPQS
jgi:hypothetical protein